MEKIGMAQGSRCSSNNFPERQAFCMDTEQAYKKMEEGNRIIEDLPTRKYAVYAVFFLLEIAACFGVVFYVI